MSVVLVERLGAVQVMTINRPAQRNAVNRAVSLALAEALDLLDADDALRVGIVTGAGGSFCSGMDLKAFVDGERPELEGRGFAGVTEAPPAKPLIAAVEGFALAGGCELALACDLIVAGDGAAFGLPEVSRGLVAGSGGLVRLRERIPPAIALEYALTGARMDAATAHRWGLVNRLVDRGGALDAALSGRLSSFEMLWGDAYERVVDAQLDQFKRPIPLPKGHGFYVVVEAMGSDKESDDAQFERALAAELESGLVVDAALATSDSQRATLWGVRDEMHVGFMELMPFCNYDVSMAHAVMTTFVARVREDLGKRFPRAVSYFYGHAGDGNLHAIVNPMEPGPLDALAVDEIVFGVVRDLGGSIAAEHGIGTLRRQFLDWTRSEDELWLMRTMKAAIDPKNILNPGKVL
ncbi:MAG: crotonase/enoyl-CoA hydratase family protein [Sphingomonadales bacterium]|nr:MAG: crotonase/enoyl-CoA hydratase family protein [Sphingomonadales bacterium]